MYDVVIAGAGITGCSVARYLSRYKGKICVVEREEDVCCGTTKANSAIVHGGFDAANGSLKARYNVEGSQMMPELARELDFPFERNGSLVICMNEEDLPKLKELYENGVKNGVEGLEIIDKKTLHEKEKNISEDAVAALWAPTGGIVCPFNMTYAMAENAADNGVEFRFDTEITDIKKTDDGFELATTNGIIKTRTVVNAAGVYADELHNYVSERKLHITPRRGDYCLLDHTAGDHVKSTIFQLPGKFGKGVLVTPTVHGNLLVGPTAFAVEGKEETNTTSQGINDLIQKAGVAVRDIPMRQVITSFAGLRATEDGEEFIIGEVADAPGFFDCAGIESPGLSSAPAIGREVADMVASKLKLPENTEFNGTRKGFVSVKELDKEELKALIKENPAYGQIICRCETISEGEIIDAVHRSVGAKSLDGVKRRVRAGMGRCQAGFCSPRVLEILSRELGIPKEEITKSGGNSRLIVGHIKDQAL